MILPVTAGWVVCIADGTGGISGGAKAADLFVARVRRATLEPHFDVVDPLVWTTLLENIDNEIATESMAGETTGIAIAITADLVVGASSGDSRAYLSTRHGWRELTSDQFRKPRLGTGRARPQPFSAEAHGILVVGTDGLFDYAKFDDISRAALPISDGAGEALVQLVLDQHRTLPDDIAVVVGWLD